MKYIVKRNKIEMLLAPECIVYNMYWYCKKKKPWHGMNEHLKRKFPYRLQFFFFFTNVCSDTCLYSFSIKIMGWYLYKRGFFLTLYLSAPAVRIRISSSSAQKMTSYPCIWRHNVFTVQAGYRIVHFALDFFQWSHM